MNERQENDRNDLPDSSEEAREGAGAADAPREDPPVGAPDPGLDEDEGTGLPSAPEGSGAWLFSREQPSSDDEDVEGADQDLDDTTGLPEPPDEGQAPSGLADTGEMASLEDGQPPADEDAVGQRERGSAANADVVPGGKRSSRRETKRKPGRLITGKRIGIAAAFFFLLVALGVAGVAYATYNYAQEYDGKILPGSRIAGVDVSGMTRSQAIRAVKHQVRPQLTRSITVSWKDREWTVTPGKLGARSNVNAVVAAALDASGETSFMQKMRMRMLGDDMGFKRKVAITYPRQGVRGFVEGLASNLNRKSRDATLDYSSGWVEITPSRTGHYVLAGKSRDALHKALRQGDSHVELAVKTTQPEVTEDAYDQVLLVRIGENHLYFYQDGEITHDWPVATGQPEYMTPTGVYEVTELRYMPTWINPAPDTWGSDMPKEIPPGPGNPLGVRAINWSAPAIRFHGTSATYSLGYNASHGCVRMSNEDVIELYNMVEVGTPIVSVVAGELKPLYTSSSTDPIPVAEDSDDGNRGG